MKKNLKVFFLLQGKNLIRNVEQKDKLEPILKNYNYTRFYDFEENPKIEDVEKGVDVFNENQCDLIIASWRRKCN